MNTYSAITADDVDQAIAALGDLSDPTTWPNVNAIRDYVGRGSWTTIQKHLTAARQRARTTASQAPPAVVELMQRCGGDIWRLALDAARSQDSDALQQAHTDKEALAARIAEQDEQIQQALEEVQRLEQALAEAVALNEDRAVALHNAAEAAETAATAHRAACAAAQTQIEELQQVQTSLRLRLDQERHDHNAALITERQTHAAAVTELRAEMATAHEQHASTTQQLYSQIEDLRAARNLAIARGESWEQQAHGLQERLDQAAATREHDTEHLAALREECAALRAQRDAALTQVDGARADVAMMAAMVKQATSADDDGDRTAQNGTEPHQEP